MKSFSLRGWLPFVVVLSMLAGCRSERVAFDFGRPVYAQPVAEPLTTPEPAAQPTTTADSTVHSAALSIVARHPARRQPQLVVSSLVPAKAAPKAVRQALHQLTPMKQRRPSAAAARPAENGLKNIFFFALGVVLLVLAGLAWAVSAIFSIGFWAALGYVAAGIVVLLLLRSLVRKLVGKK